MTKIRIGIIGAGYIAGVHAGVLARDERVQITAVHDVVPTSAERLAGTHRRGRGARAALPHRSRTEQRLESASRLLKRYTRIGGSKLNAQSSRFGSRELGTLEP